MPDRHLFKAVANPGLITEAVKKWTAAGRDPRLLLTDYRHHDLYLPHGSWEEVKAQWRAMFFRFVNRTYLEQHAANVKMVEENNEYFTSNSIQNPAELSAYLLSVRAAVAIWNNEFRGRTVTSPDGGQGLIPADCRLVIANGFVANDIPREYFELALSDDCVLAYHAYSKYENGARWPDDWPNHSGRWERMEQQFGLKPIWAFTETGPYFDSGAGWRDPKCLGNDENKLVAAMRQFYTDLAGTAAYREGRLLGAAWFTCVAFGWRGYYLETPQLTRIADEAREIWHPGVIMPTGIIIDVSRWQGQPDWVALKNAGVVDATIRATMGATGVDSEYARNWRESVRAGIQRRGIYHYVVTTHSAPAQVNNILQTTGGDFGNMPLVLDCERTAAEKLAGNFPKNAYTGLVRQMLDILTPIVPTRIYTSANEWQEMTTLPSWAEGIVDWIAHYSTTISAPALPPGVTTWRRWQYGSGPVDGLTVVDLNRDNLLIPIPIPPSGELTMAEKLEIEKHLDAIWVIMWPKVKAAIPCGLYSAPGGALVRTLTDGRNMDVFNKVGSWLLVTQAPNPVYWVRQDQIVMV